MMGDRYEQGDAKKSTEKRVDRLGKKNLAQENQIRWINSMAGSNCIVQKLWMVDIGKLEGSWIELSF